jgi:hypothetical protein
MNFPVGRIVPVGRIGLVADQFGCALKGHDFNRAEKSERLCNKDTALAGPQMQQNE